MNGRVRFFVHPNRKGQPKFWSYFEPTLGLSLSEVHILYGPLETALTDLKVETKQRSAYDIREKIEQRKEDGYTVLRPITANALNEVLPVIRAWQAAVLRKEHEIVNKDWLSCARSGLRIFGGDCKLLRSPTDPKPRMRRIDVITTKLPARYNW